MKRFQNAIFEYIEADKKLSFKDGKTNTAFFSIEFTEEKNMKKIFSAYPVNIEIENKILELSFTVENLQMEKTILTVCLDIFQLKGNKSTIIDVYEENLKGIMLN